MPAFAKPKMVISKCLEIAPCRYNGAMSVGLTLVVMALVLLSIFSFRANRRIRNQQAVLRETDERYRNFVRNATEGIYRIDFIPPVPLDLPEKDLIERLTRNSFVGEVNEHLARMYGLSPADMIGHPARVDHYYGGHVIVNSKKSGIKEDRRPCLSKELESTQWTGRDAHPPVPFMTSLHNKMPQVIERLGFGNVCSDSCILEHKLEQGYLKDGFGRREAGLRRNECSQTGGSGYFGKGMESRSRRSSRYDRL